MELIPVLEHLDENPEFVNNLRCRESLQMTVDFYKRIGFLPPWIGYYVKENEILVGCAAFKGRPVNGMIEIAYGTFEEFRNQGVGTNICKILVDLALKTDPAVRVTARTLAENNYSTKILKKNKFQFIGGLVDPDDGDIWEWEYKSGNNNEI
jgi:[ribosomal protein S5]-alanine N-acetyltransferase